MSSPDSDATDPRNSRGRTAPIFYMRVIPDVSVTIQQPAVVTASFRNPQKVTLIDSSYYETWHVTSIHTLVAELLEYGNC
jgi:hypothetical protein